MIYSSSCLLEDQEEMQMLNKWCIKFNQLSNVFSILLVKDILFTYMNMSQSLSPTEVIESTSP